ncbi:MAG: hypothetical protein ACKO3T_07595 [Planctomycetaceae bacterium]
MRRQKQSSLTLLVSSLLWIVQVTSAPAGLMIRITADPGGASENVMTFTDDDAFDLDNTAGNIFIAAFSVFDNAGNQTFDVNSLSVSSSTTLAPIDFDVLLDLLSFDAGKLRLEVTQTDLDSSFFINGGMYLADIGGTAGIFVPGMTMSYVSGFDAGNQAFNLATTVPQFDYTGGSQTFSYSGSASVSPLVAPFSMTARYDFTATGGSQDIGFNSFNEMGVPVPEPGSLTAAVACTGLILWRLRKRRSSDVSVSGGESACG